MPDQPAASSHPVPLPVGQIPTLRVFAMPADTNPAGNVFGGWIMAQVDIAGSVPARVRALGRVSTVAVNAFQFKEPVYVGDLLSFYANVIQTGRTSITIDVEVFAERMIDGEFQAVRVTEATLVYVATDEQHKPRPLPPA